MMSAIAFLLLLHVVDGIFGPSSHFPHNQQLISQAIQDSLDGEYLMYDIYDMQYEETGSTQICQVTNSGCICRRKWSFESVNYRGCANPDGDLRGDWCVVDPYCPVSDLLGVVSNADGTVVRYDYCPEDCIRPPIDCTRSNKGCECLKQWTFNSYYNLNGCANPDNDPYGPWCFVKRSTCPQDTEVGSALSLGQFSHYDYCPLECERFVLEQSRTDANISNTEQQFLYLQNTTISDQTTMFGPGTETNDIQDGLYSNLERFQLNGSFDDQEPFRYEIKIDNGLYNEDVAVTAPISEDMREETYLDYQLEENIDYQTQENNPDFDDVQQVRQELNQQSTTAQDSFNIGKQNMLPFQPIPEENTTIIDSQDIDSIISSQPIPVIDTDTTTDQNLKDTQEIIYAQQVDAVEPAPEQEITASLEDIEEIVYDQQSESYLVEYLTSGLTFVPFGYSTDQNESRTGGSIQALFFPRGIVKENATIPSDIYTQQYMLQPSIEDMQYYEEQPMDEYQPQYPFKPVSPMVAPTQYNYQSPPVIVGGYYYSTRTYVGQDAYKDVVDMEQPPPSVSTYINYIVQSPSAPVQTPVATSTLARPEDTVRQRWYYSLGAAEFIDTGSVCDVSRAGCSCLPIWTYDADKDGKESVFRGCIQTKDARGRAWCPVDPNTCREGAIPASEGLSPDQRTQTPWDFCSKDCTLTRRGNCTTTLSGCRCRLRWTYEGLLQQGCTRPDGTVAFPWCVIREGCETALGYLSAEEHSIEWDICPLNCQ
eukprot:TRINITY_DN1390_c0_g1_i3.p1 TRINITY_DN1390_c0_g1~~TRINITY_DN1390_c0_g1_i3.p1  ORF type:complete len:764 (+),score=45.12 TRINITY_DN1390_c0_g1_i3:1016-3307(+)